MTARSFAGTQGRYDSGIRTLPLRRLLIVDDDDDNRRIVSKYLEFEGYEVLTASNGPDALSILNEGHISLVVLDVNMPDMDGLEVCRRLRDNPKCRKTPVIFLTASRVDREAEESALEAGGDEYLHRPVSRRMLTLRVRNLLRLADAEREEQILAQMAQSEKLAAIGQVAAGVAHEINNPLAFVLSNLETLRQYFEEFNKVLEAWRRSPEEGAAAEAAVDLEMLRNDVRPLLDETVDGGDRMRTIVRELKSFMRGQDDLMEPVDLAEVARSTLVLTERDISHKATLVRDLAPAWIESAPRQRLHQVVLNLVVNAKQALETRPLEPGQSHRIEVSTRTEGDCALITVADTGSGIPDDIRQRIFEPFFTTKPVGVGVGLGLSLCAMVMETVGGAIELDSQVGRGTRFTLRIPVARPRPASSASAIQVAPGQS